MTKALQGRQNICAMRDGRQRFFSSAFSKSTLYDHFIGKAERRTLENGNRFRVRMDFTEKMILVTFVETKVTLRSNYSLEDFAEQKY